MQTYPISLVDMVFSCLEGEFKIAPITIEKDKLDIDNLSNNSFLQIIPNKKENKFEKDRYTLLQISA